MAIRVLLPQPILPAGYEYLREHGYEVVDGRGFTEDDIVADITDCDAIIVRTAKITKRIFDAAPKLKILARHGAGYDGVDLAAAREHGVLVCTAGGANAISVAELTIFYMLYCSRNFKKVQKLYLEDYRQAKMGVPKTELEGKTLGLVGLGNIGKLVAKKAALGFDMTVLAYDPFAKKEGLPEYIQLVEDRDEIFKQSDYVSLHVPRHPRDHPLRQRPGVRPDEGDRLSHQRRPGLHRGRARPGPRPPGGQDRRRRSGHPGEGAHRPRQSPGGHGQRPHRPPTSAAPPRRPPAGPPWPAPRPSTTTSPAAPPSSWCPSCGNLLNK